MYNTIRKQVKVFPDTSERAWSNLENRSNSVWLKQRVFLFARVRRGKAAEVGEVMTWLVSRDTQFSSLPKVIGC